MPPSSLRAIRLLGLKCAGRGQLMSQMTLNEVDNNKTQLVAHSCFACFLSCLLVYLFAAFVFIVREWRVEQKLNLGSDSGIQIQTHQHTNTTNIEY